MSGPASYPRAVRASFPATAIVLAGGFGTRLRTVVSDVPKPMAPVGGKPFVAYVLDLLAAQGVRRVCLAVGYLGEKIEAYFGEGYGGMELLYSYERSPLGTGGAVARALARLSGDAPVWVVNGDTYFEVDLEACRRVHAATSADVTLALKHMTAADRYGVVDTDASDRITAFREKTSGSSGAINAGCYLLRPGVLGGWTLPAPAFSLERDFFEAYVGEAHLQGCVQEGYFVDIGIPDDYAAAQRRFG